MFLFSLLQLSWKKHLFQLKPNSSDVRDLFQYIFDCFDLKLFYWNTLAKNTTRVLNIYSTYTNQRLNLSTTIEKRSNNIGEIELRVTSQRNQRQGEGTRKEIVNQSLRISSKKPEKFESYFMRQHNFQTLNVVILSFNFKFILDEIKRNSLIL